MWRAISDRLSVGRTWQQQRRQHATQHVCGTAATPAPRSALERGAADHCHQRVSRHQHNCGDDQAHARVLPPAQRGRWRVVRPAARGGWAAKNELRHSVLETERFRSGKPLWGSHLDCQNARSHHMWRRSTRAWRLKAKACWPRLSVFSTRTSSRSPRPSTCGAQ